MMNYNLISAVLEFQTDLISEEIAVFFDEESGFLPAVELLKLFTFQEAENGFVREKILGNETYFSVFARRLDGGDADLEDLSDIFLTLHEFFSPEKACFSTDYGKKFEKELKTIKGDFYSKLSAELREKPVDYWFSDVALILTYQQKGSFSCQIDPDFYQKSFPNVRICISVFA